MHRMLFRRHRTQFLVSAAHRLAYAGLLLMGLALAGVTVIIFGAVAGTTAGAIAGACAAVAQLAFWVVLPLWVRHRGAPTSPSGCAVGRPVCTAGKAGNTPAMLIRRIARPLLSAVFIGQGIETLRNPRSPSKRRRPTVAALRTLPEPYGEQGSVESRDRRADQCGRPGQRWSVARDRQTAADRLGGTGVHRDTGQPWRASVLD